MDFAATPLMENDRVRLESLDHAHAETLSEAAAEGDLWRTWYTRIPSPEAMGEEIQRRHDLQAQGCMAPYAVVNPGSGAAIGMTMFMNLDPQNRRLEIGSTWLGKASQGTSINPAIKLLMLERAFDQLGCIAVEFRTHWFNHQSRAALAKLGAKQDAVLRNHMILPDGTVRDTVVFSIIDAEWPTVRVGLEHRLGMHLPQ